MALAMYVKSEPTRLERLLEREQLNLKRFDVSEEQELKMAKEIDSKSNSFDDAVVQMYSTFVDKKTQMLQADVPEEHFQAEEADNADDKKDNSEYIEARDDAFVAESKYTGIEPILGRNIASMFLTGLLNLFAYPGWNSVIDFFLNLFFFFFWTFVGGLVGSSTFIAFEADKLTYHHAGLTEFDLYKSTMVLMKDMIYTFLGEPHFMDNEQEKKQYIPPQEVMLDWEEQ